MLLLRTLLVAVLPSVAALAVAVLLLFWSSPVPKNALLMTLRKIFNCCAVISAATLLT